LSGTALSRPIPAWKARLKGWTDAEWLRQHEDKVLLVLTLVIGALVGLVIVAFILVTENLGSACILPKGLPGDGSSYPS
jgi:hypothetical protein